VFSFPIRSILTGHLSWFTLLERIDILGSGKHQKGDFPVADKSQKNKAKMNKPKLTKKEKKAKKAAKVAAKNSAITPF
jgi:hypothetical protein